MFASNQYCDGVAAEERRVRVGKNRRKPSRSPYQVIDERSKTEDELCAEIDEAAWIVDETTAH